MQWRCYFQYLFTTLNSVSIFCDQLGPRGEDVGFYNRLPALLSCCHMQLHVVHGWILCWTVCHNICTWSVNVNVRPPCWTSQVVNGWKGSFQWYCVQTFEWCLSAFFLHCWICACNSLFRWNPLRHTRHSNCKEDKKKYCTLILVETVTLRYKCRVPQLLGHYQNLTMIRPRKSGNTNVNDGTQQHT